MKNLGCYTKALEVSFAKRMQELQERISILEDNVEEITRSKKNQAQNIHEIWNTMERRNLQIIGIEKREETQAKSTENIF